MRSNLVIWRELAIKFNGNSIRGSFSVSGGMVTVKSPYGSKMTQVGVLRAENLARIMLGELAQEGKTG